MTRKGLQNGFDFFTADKKYRDRFRHVYDSGIRGGQRGNPFRAFSRRYG